MRRVDTEHDTNERGQLGFPGSQRHARRYCKVSGVCRAEFQKTRRQQERLGRRRLQTPLPQRERTTKSSFG